MQVIIIIVFIAAVLFLMPVLLLVVQSGNGYMELLFHQFQFYPMFWNSVFYALFISIFQIMLDILSAFGLMCVKMKGKNGLFLLFVILMMMPQQVTILPNFIGLRTLGLINTRAGILLPAVFAPYGVVILFQYMKGCNFSAIEAARLETGSVFKILRYAVLPQMKECIMAVFLLLFAESYNMLEQPLLFLKDDKLKTLSIFVSKAEEYGENVTLSATVIYILPVFFLYLLFQDSFEKGMK